MRLCDLQRALAWWLPVGVLLAGPLTAADLPAGSLSSAAEASARAAEMLAAGQTGPDVRALQEEVERVVRDLADRLAPHAAVPTSMPSREGEARLFQQGTSTGKPTTPAKESVLPSGNWAGGRLPAEGEAGAWQPELPPAELKKLSDALAQGRLPSYYRNRLRAYSRGLAEVGGEGTHEQP